MRKYREFMVEISGKILEPYLHKAGLALKTMVSSPDKQILLPKIIKRSKGMKAAKARPMEFYKKTYSDVLKLTPKQAYLVKMYGDKLLPAIRHDSSNPHTEAENLIRVVATYDPSEKAENYLEFMVRTYVNRLWRYEDKMILGRTLRQFDSIKSQLENKDINSYKNLDQVYDAIESKKPKLSNNATMELVKRAGTTIIVNEANFKFLKLNNFGAVKAYCAGTKWCFTDSLTFRDYRHGLYLIIAKIDDQVRKFAVHFNTEQFMDERDAQIKTKDTLALLSYKGFDKVLELAFRSHDESHFFFGLIIDVMPKLEQRNKMVEKFVFKRKYLNDMFEQSILFDYVTKFKVRIPEFEEWMVDDDFDNVDEEFFVGYVQKVMAGKRWPELEAQLVKLHHIEPIHYEYAKRIIKGRFEEIEPLMVKNFNVFDGYLDWDIGDTLDYAVNVAEVRLPGIEKKLLKILPSLFKSMITYKTIKTKASEAAIKMGANIKKRATIKYAVVKQKSYSTNSYFNTITRHYNLAQKYIKKFLTK